MTFSASSLNFGVLEVGLTSVPQSVTVTNVSGHAATFSSIATSGDFVQTNSCPTTLNAGQNCSITVNFKPKAAGARTGTVTLKDNDPGSPTQTITLAGTGETVALGFTPASLNFGSVQAGSSIMQSATLTNDGAAPVKITGITISGVARRDFHETNNCPATLNVQESCTVQVVFSPADVAPYVANVAVKNSAGGSVTLPLKGSGVDGG